jgi:hypothetical protein
MFSSLNKNGQAKLELQSEDFLDDKNLRRKVEILEVKADKIEELQRTIDDVKIKLGLT